MEVLAVYFLIAIAVSYSYWEYCNLKYGTNEPYTAAMLGLFWPLLLLFVVAYVQTRMSK